LKYSLFSVSKSLHGFLHGVFFILISFRTWSFLGVAKLGVRLTCECVLSGFYFSKFSSDSWNIIQSDIALRVDYSRLMYWLTGHCARSRLWSCTVLHCITKGLIINFIAQYLRTCLRRSLRPGFPLNTGRTVLHIGRFQNQTVFADKCQNFLEDFLCSTQWFFLKLMERSCWFVRSSPPHLLPRLPFLFLRFEGLGITLCLKEAVNVSL